MTLICRSFRCVTILICNLFIIREYIILYTFSVMGISYIISLFVYPGLSIKISNNSELDVVPSIGCYSIGIISKFPFSKSPGKLK